MDDATFIHSDVSRSILRNKRDLRQVERVELIKGILARGHVRGRQFLIVQGIGRMVAPVGEVATTVAVGSRWNLVASKDWGVIGIVVERLLELSQTILGDIAFGQNIAKEGTRRIVLDIELDADGLEVGLQDQLVGGTPGIVGRGGVEELHAFAILGADAIRSFSIAILIEQSVGGIGIKGRAGSIGLIARIK